MDPAPLLAFRASFANGAKALPDWSNASAPCRWEGVICDETGVVELRLADKGLKGTLSATWSLPPTVRKLNLGGNAIYGCAVVRGAACKRRRTRRECRSGPIPGSNGKRMLW